MAALCANTALMLLPMLLATMPFAASVSTCSSGYAVSGAGTVGVDGCYLPAEPRYGSVAFNQSGGRGLVLFRREQGWVIGTPGIVTYYSSTCTNSTNPPAAPGWKVTTAGVAPAPNFDGPAPLGACPSPASPTPPAPPKPHPRCNTPECDALWGPSGCPDLYSIMPDLVRPPMVNAIPAAGARVRAVAPGFEHTKVYHPLYLPREWVAGSEKYPIIVEYMGNGPWSDGYGDVSTGRPEDSNLGWGMAEPAGSTYIWISMPFVSSDMGIHTEISTYWWGCPSTNAARPCGTAYDIQPTLNYLHSALQQTFDLYRGDPERVVIMGWSRGAIATGAIGLHDEETSKLFRAFMPYSHLDGDCGWVDQESSKTLAQRWARLGGRPALYLGECAVATQSGPAWLEKIGQNGTKATSRMEFMTTGFANHNDAWVLRNSTARAYMRKWLKGALAIPADDHLFI